MTMYLTRYFFNELSSWVWLTPVPLGFAFLLTMESSTTFLAVVIIMFYACAIVFPQYATVRKNYATVLHVAPIAKKNLIQTDFLFLHWISAGYLAYGLIGSTILALFVHKKLIFPSFQELCFLIGCVLLLCTLTCWLLLIKNLPTNFGLLFLLWVPVLFPAAFIFRFVLAYGVYFLGAALLISAFSYVTIIRIAEGSVRA